MSDSFIRRYLEKVMEKVSPHSYKYPMMSEERGGTTTPEKDQTAVLIDWFLVLLDNSLLPSILIFQKVAVMKRGMTCLTKRSKHTTTATAAKIDMW